MNMYVIIFQVLNIKKEKIICFVFVYLEIFFFVVYFFEDKNCGCGYVIMFVSELLFEELMVKNFFKKNINFWFNECGLSKFEVINEVINWKNFVYIFKELEEVKNEVIRELWS